MICTPRQNISFKDNEFSVGLNLNLTDADDIMVEGIWLGSSAEKAGITTGDVIVAFNAHKATKENLVDLITLMQDDEIKSILLKVQNSDGEQEITLNKTLLF